MKDSTELIKANNSFDTVNGKTVHTINPPIYSASTILFENYEDLSLANSGKYPGITYGTDRLPTQRAFEEALRNLENGYLTRAFQSGISAISNTLLAFTKSGDHILVCDNVYGPTARFCSTVLSRYNIAVEYIPAAIGKEISHYIQPNTRLIFLESPGSNTFEIQDIPEITQIAQEKNIITILDNTWATPLYLKPLDMGIDVSIQSITKYIAGHSDLLLGAVTINKRYAEEFDKYYNSMEIYASQQDCSLALRGLKTLTLRLKQHETSALKIAHWLKTQILVDKIIHPALPEHPQYHLWQRDFGGSSGLFAFIFKQNYHENKIATFVNTLQLFGIGYSWGGFKSLITAGKYRRNTTSEYSGRIIIRLNIGLEDSDDLIADLQNAFKSFKTLD